MRWEGERQSDNVEDLRGSPAMGRGPGGIRVAGMGGLGAIVIAVIAMLMGVDPSKLLSGGDPGGPSSITDPPSRTSSADQDPRATAFVRTVLASTEDTWTMLFRNMGARYQLPKLVLFSNAVDSACGNASASMGPFYCPADRKVYLDLTFFEELSRKYQAPGDFAQAYVIGHEVGHHVQNLMGTSDKVHAQRRSLSEAQYNQLSVRLELQADFYAGVWAHHANKTRQILEAGDVEEAMTAATAIGDDRLQKQARGYVVPDSFTHGTSAQRVRWFKKGLLTGDVAQGDTFSARDL